MNIYHLAIADDQQADEKLHKIEERISAVGGRVHVSKGHGSTAAVLVMVLPAGITPEHIVPELPALEPVAVLEEETGPTEEEDTQATPETPAQAPEGAEEGNNL